MIDALFPCFQGVEDKPHEGALIKVKSKLARYMIQGGSSLGFEPQQWLAGVLMLALCLV